MVGSRDKRREKQRDRRGGTEDEEVTGEGEEDEGEGRHGEGGAGRGKEGGGKSRPPHTHSFLKVGAYAIISSFLNTPQQVHLINIR